MAAVVALKWTSVILQFLPQIMKIGQELYSLYCSIKGAKQDRDTVLRAMKLLNRHQDDIDRLLQNPEEKRELLDGLTALMRRINESNGNGNTGSPKDDGRNNNSTPCGGGGGGASVPSRSSFKGAVSWMECDVCRGDYNTATKRPLILHCGHTFCCQCVGELSRRGLIKCPTCRSCETRSCASIPTNTALMYVLDDCGEGKGEGKGSWNSDNKDSGCDSTTQSYEQQIQFAILLSKQQAEAQGRALVEQRWQEVEEASDRMLAVALQESEVYEASRKCAERCRATPASAPPHLPQEESEWCAASSSGGGGGEDEDASVLLAYKLQQEEVAKMQRLCGNTTNDWTKEMDCFFGPSLHDRDEDCNNLRREEHHGLNGREPDGDDDGDDDDDDGGDGGGEDEATCCTGRESEGGATCHWGGDNGEEEEMCCTTDQDGKKSSCSDDNDDDDDLKKCCGDRCGEERSDERHLALMRGEEELLIEMAIQLSLNYPQPSDPENK